MKGHDRSAPAWTLALVLAAACSAEAPLDTRADEAVDVEAREGEGEARATVVALLDAFAAHDCDSIARRLGGALRARMSAESCANFLADEPLRTAEVRRVGPARVDGRDPRSFFVTVSVVEAGRPRPVVVRVERGRDGHRVVSM